MLIFVPPMHNDLLLKRVYVRQAVVLPVATANPVASAAEHQEENDNNQEQIHGIPPFRMRRGGIALPIASTILYASLQIQLLAE
jgi:hypothetical protein